MSKLLPTTCALLLLLLFSPAHAAGSPPPATRTIVLVRHGNYVDDPAADPRLGPHISPIGVAQAHLVGARLAAMPIRFDVLYASPLQRARDTAAVIAEDFPGRHFEVVDDLAECTPPTRRPEIMAQEKPEDLASCQAQLDRVFARFFRPAAGHEETDLLVCHGNVIRYLVTRALGVALDGIAQPDVIDELAGQRIGIEEGAQLGLGLGLGGGDHLGEVQRQGRRATLGGVEAGRLDLLLERVHVVVDGLAGLVTLDPALPAGIGRGSELEVRGVFLAQGGELALVVLGDRDRAAEGLPGQDGGVLFLFKVVDFGDDVAHDALLVFRVAEEEPTVSLPILYARSR